MLCERSRIFINISTGGNILRGLKVESLPQYVTIPRFGAISSVG